MTLLRPLPNRRIGPRPCQGPIERRDFAVASPNRRRPTECKSKAAPAQIEGAHFLLIFILFFPLHLYALQYGCNSVGFIFLHFLLLLYKC